MCKPKYWKDGCFFGMGDNLSTIMSVGKDIKCKHGSRKWLLLALLINTDFDSCLHSFVFKEKCA